ncbi:polynucleotide kinase [Proteus phage Privateer]|uniref:Polynucleotide kinase n=1 Tax=Proteus phage Privateer TaxID=2712958 RepID=A0A6G8R3Y8_9CAUD|nr:polynucleotide kinase [Proteus phage Privateer]QIN94912.1 polynucleotide kinase [Proteus phage Privateer]
MKKLILTIGSAGAGKTTWTNRRCKRDLGRIAVVSLDNLRTTLFGDMDKKEFFSRLNNKETLSLMKNMMKAQVIELSKRSQIKEIIICNTNFNIGTVLDWKMLADYLDLQFCYKLFEKPFEELVKINRERPSCDRVPISFLKLAIDLLPEVKEGLENMPHCTKIGR